MLKGVSPNTFVLFVSFRGESCVGPPSSHILRVKMRKTKFLKLKMREASFISRALLSTRHPVLAHLIPMRRCNLACGYCNEYDHTSKPIDLDLVKSRLNKLADLGTSVVTISGGEPMMHPELDQI